MTEPKHLWRDPTIIHVQQRINPMRKSPQHVENERTRFLIVFSVCVLIWAALMLISQPEPAGYAAAREASLIEGQQFPEGHGR